jgi:hypothetical protein
LHGFPQIGEKRNGWVNEKGLLEEIRRMTLPESAFGNLEAQERFIRENQRFVEEIYSVFSVAKKIFDRSLAPPSAEEFQKISKLPDDSDAVVEFMNKFLAERTAFYLGRIAVDDFSEILLLAANGFGFGALKILRSMYEHVVTSIFIGQNPAEARIFAEDSPIKRHKIWKKTLEAMPEIIDRYTEPQIEQLEAAHSEARSKRSISICKKCGQPRTQEAWTRVDLAQMADKTDPKLGELYAGCYLEPVCHSHSTAFGLELRLVDDGTKVTYRSESPAEARRAAILGHNLILRTLAFQSEYFHLALDEEVQARFEKFVDIWGAGGGNGEQSNATNL